MTEKSRREDLISSIEALGALLGILESDKTNKEQTEKSYGIMAGNPETVKVEFSTNFRKIVLNVELTPKDEGVCVNMKIDESKVDDSNDYIGVSEAFIAILANKTTSSLEEAFKEVFDL